MGVINSLEQLVNKLMGRNKVNYDDGRLRDGVFYAIQLKQHDYDHEIDEGLSSGLKRYVTLDLSELSRFQKNEVINGIVRAVKNYDLCKLVQVAGFNKAGKSYVIVSGESHYLYQRAAQDGILNRIKPLTGKYSNVKCIDYFVPFPDDSQSKKYEPTDLGEYGSTGCPGLWIPEHPDAKRLREQGKIR